MKPHPYPDRRLWQLAARARGDVPECGHEACTRPASPAWVGSGTGTELLYCAECAAMINQWNPGTCRPEVAATRPILYAPAHLADDLRARLAAAGLDVPVVTEIPDGWLRKDGFASLHKAALPRDIAVYLPPPEEEPEPKPPNPALLASLFGVAGGVDLDAAFGVRRAPTPNPDRGRHAEKTARRRERKAERARGGGR